MLPIPYLHKTHAADFTLACTVQLANKCIAQVYSDAMCGRIRTFSPKYTKEHRTGTCVPWTQLIRDEEVTESETPVLL